MKSVKTLLRCLFAATIVAAALVLAYRAPKGVDTDMVSLLFPSGGGILRSLTENSARTINVLFEGKEKKDVVAAAKLFTPPSAGTATIKGTLEKIGARKDGLLSGEDRELVVSGKTHEIAQNAVSSIFGFAPRLFPLREDPFFLAASYVTSMQAPNSSGWQLENGIPVKHDGTNFLALASIDAGNVSPEEILRKKSAFGENPPGVKIWIGGAPIHSAISENAAEKEINALSAISVALCLVLGLVLIRSFKFIPFLLCGLGASFCVSAASVFLAFERPHVLTLVFGTSLIGLSVDYTFHTFASSDRKVAKPLTFALLTTLACFAPLFLSSATILRQMALFTISGLLTMYSAVLLFAFDLKIKAPVRTDDGISPKSPKSLFFAKAILCLLASAGIFRLETKNDLTRIYKPVPFLAESEKRIAEAGGSSFSKFTVVKGATLQEALEREEKNSIRGLSAIVPSLKKQRENFELKKALYAKELAGFAKATGISPLPLPEKPSFLEPSDLSGTALEKVLNLSTVKTKDAVYTVSPATGARTPEDGSISTIEPKRVISEALNDYTRETIRLVFWAFGTLGLLILAIFAKKSPRYILPTAAAVASTLGTMGWIGEPLNFFHSLCLFVFTGLGLDYTIFHLSNRSRTLRKTVLFSFLTSLTGLGMLAFTSFSVTRSMGLTLALGLSFAYFYSLSGGNAETPRGSGQWFEQKEQSAGKIRIWILWYLYSLAGKGLVKAICIPVIACIYPFAAPAKCALGKFRRKIRLIAKERGLPEPEMPSLFGHLLGFAWSMVDKTDACTLAKNPPVMEFRDDDSKKFLELVESKKGVMVVSSHVGTIEVLPCAKSSTANCPHVHAFKQLGHNSIFTEMLSSKLDTSNLTVHPTEEIGVETAVRMKENIDKGDLVIMAGDRLSAGNSNASLTRTFLGEKCKFPKGVFVFAKLMEAPVFFVTCVRTGWNKYEIHVKEHSGELQPGKILDGFAAFLEKETLAHPGEWFHFHDFFMTDRD